MIHYSKADMNQVLFVVYLMLSLGSAMELCSTDLIPTNSMEIIATCEDDGIGVTWQPLLDSAVKLIQLEYRCREVTAHNQESFDGATNYVLLSNSLSISGTRDIPYIISQGSHIECEISGCTTEGWFSYSYAIPPLYVTCDRIIQTSSTENYHTLPPVSTQQIQLSTSTANSVSYASMEFNSASLIQPLATTFPRTSTVDGLTGHTRTQQYKPAKMATVSPLPDSSATHLKMTFTMAPVIIITGFVLLVSLLLYILLLTLFLVIYVQNKRTISKVPSSSEGSWDNYSSTDDKKTHQFW